MSTRLTLLIITALSLLALNCSNDKKDNIYNRIDFNSIKPETLVIGEEIYKNTKAETRVTVLGHVQRGAPPTHRDRLIASAFGVYAVDLIEKEKFNRIVIWKDRGVTDVDLESIAGKSKKVN